MPPKTIQLDYLTQVREFLKPGDGVAFVGRKGFYSWIIRTLTGRPSHVAPIAWIVDETGRDRVVIVEALEGHGVIPSYLSERIEGYDGEVYIMELEPCLPFNAEKAAAYLKNMIGTTYSMLGAIASAPGQWLGIAGTSFFNAVFCSKLHWWSLFRGGLGEQWIGPDQTPTPNQIKRLPLWRKFIQIHGEPRAL